MGSPESGEGILVMGRGGVKRARDVKGWREKFAGTNTDDSGFFDESFAGLVKASYNQIKAR
jgi:hypothetical protein